MAEYGTKSKIRTAGYGTKSQAGSGQTGGSPRVWSSVRAAAESPRWTFERGVPARTATLLEAGARSRGRGIGIIFVGVDFVSPGLAITLVPVGFAAVSMAWPWAYVFIIRASVLHYITPNAHALASADGTAKQW